MKSSSLQVQACTFGHRIVAGFSSRRAFALSRAGERVRKDFLQTYSIAIPRLVTGHLEHGQLPAKLTWTYTDDCIYYDLFIFIFKYCF